jgi:hypothetical protein
MYPRGTPWDRLLNPGGQVLLDDADGGGGGGGGAPDFWPLDYEENDQTGRAEAAQFAKEEADYPLIDPGGFNAFMPEAEQKWQGPRASYSALPPPAYGWGDFSRPAKPAPAEEPMFIGARPGDAKGSALASLGEQGVEIAARAEPDAEYELPRVDLAHAIAAASVKARTGQPLHQIYRTLGRTDRQGRRETYQVPRTDAPAEDAHLAWLANQRLRHRMGDPTATNALSALYPGLPMGDVLGGATPVERSVQARNAARAQKDELTAQREQARVEREGAAAENRRRFDLSHGLQAQQVEGRLRDAAEDRALRKATQEATAEYQRGLMDLKQKVELGRLTIDQANAETAKLQAERSAKVMEAQQRLAERADQRAGEEHALKLKLAGAAVGEASPARQEAKYVMDAALKQAEAAGMAPEEAYRWARDLAESTQGILAEYSWPEPALAVTAARKVRQMKAEGKPEGEIRQYLQWLSTGG